MKSERRGESDPGPKAVGRAIAALRAAGLLAELGPEEKQRAAQSTTTLEEVQAALDRAGGKPLNELILEMRGPKYLTHHASRFHLHACGARSPK